MRQTFEEKMSEVIRPEVESLGYQFWGLTSPATGKKRVVRIYIDGPEGVSIDQCARVSRQVGLMLEVEDIIPGAFTLEVSSPGLDRPFFSTAQMTAYIGKDLEVQTIDAVDGRRKFKGSLKSVDGDSFTLTVDNEETTLAWENVKKARLVHEF